MARERDRVFREDEVRIGPISMFALITIICLAVLAALTFSTANASLVMTQRQATAVEELYLDETAAQEFVADVSDELARIRETYGSQVASSTAASAVEDSLIEFCGNVHDNSNGQVTATASMVNNTLYAQFTCENGRELTISATVRNGATLRIDKWKMTAVQNEEEPAGNLWTGD